MRNVAMLMLATITLAVSAAEAPRVSKDQDCAVMQDTGPPIEGCQVFLIPAPIGLTVTFVEMDAAPHFVPRKLGRETVGYPTSVEHPPDAGSWLSTVGRWRT